MIRPGRGPILGPRPIASYRLLRQPNDLAELQVKADQIARLDTAIAESRRKIEANIAAMGRAQHQAPAAASQLVAQGQMAASPQAAVVSEGRDDILLPLRTQYPFIGQIYLRQIL